MDLKRTGSKKSPTGKTMTSRATTGKAAIANRLEASRVVRNGLRRPQHEEEMSHLRAVAAIATEILTLVENVEDKVVDDEFAGLALDACALVFILINECDKTLENPGTIPDRIIWGSRELAEFGSEILLYEAVH